MTVTCLARLGHSVVRLAWRVAIQPVNVPRSQYIRAANVAGVPLLRGHLVVRSAGGVALAYPGRPGSPLVLGAAERDTAIGAELSVNLGQRAPARLVAGLNPQAGDRLFLSLEAGLATTIPPQDGSVVEVGVVDDPAAYAATSTVWAVLSRLREVL